MKRLPGVLFAITLATPLMAQNKIEGFEGRLYKNGPGRTMPYRLFIPDRYDKQKNYPLILWLHGAGGIGDDNLRQISGDQIPGTRIWTKAENQALHPAFVVVPQSPTGWSANDTKPRQALQMVLGILNSVRMEFSIDSDRIYVLGQSNGGLGAWALVTSNPHLFAAAIFVCSAGAFPRRAQSVARLPVWAFQGSKDFDAAVDATRQMISAIRKAGGNPRYTEYEGAGHDIWERVFMEPELVNWLFAQHK